MCQSALKPEELFALTGIEASTDDDLDVVEEAVRDANAYPMITLSVDSETEAEAGGRPTAAVRVEFF